MTGCGTLAEASVGRDVDHRPALAATLLGGCRVSVDGQMVDTTTSRQTRALLAYLLLHRRAPTPRDVLMDVFWPDATPSAARHNLHVALTRMRNVLREAGADGVVERHHDTYRITPRVQVRTDVEEFDSACARARRDPAAAEREYGIACQLYAGDLLAGDPYLEWALPERERLRHEMVAAQRGLMAVRLGRGEHGPAAVLARAVLTVDPADEVAHLALMESLAATGQRHLALEQYQRLARTLWRGYRIGPSAESTALYEAIKRPSPYRLPV